VENALLRERINDVAAEVARLTATLEGPTSPIEAILNSEAGHSTGAPNGSNGASLSIAPRIGESKGTLADRIRALQRRALSAGQRDGMNQKAPVLGIYNPPLTVPHQLLRPTCVIADRLRPEVLHDPDLFRGQPVHRFETERGGFSVPT
jgi:hypothetical protein